MNVDMIDVLTPTDRRGGPQLPLKVGVLPTSVRDL
jgi:hypothetical protein